LFDAFGVGGAGAGERSTGGDRGRLGVRLANRPAHPRDLARSATHPHQVPRGRTRRQRLRSASGQPPRPR
jgi:hypothetical protein